MQNPDYVVDTSASILSYKKEAGIENHFKYQLICKMRLTLAQRALLVKLFYLNQSNAAAALREFRSRNNLRKGPLSINAVKAMVKKFETTGSLTTRPGRGRKPVSEDTITDVATAIVERNQTSTAGNSSTRGVARQLDVSASTVWKVLRKILRFYPYKISLLHELKPTDYDLRLTFALTFLARVQVDEAWPWKILWSDEAHFYLNGTVNTQNSRIWASEQPHAVEEIPLHPQKLTVWCGFTADFIIGPYFFEIITQAGPQTCSVNTQRYHDMLSSFVIPQLQQRQCLDKIIFMQDGAPPHIGKSVQQLLRHHFTEERVISRCFHVAWPPRSPDLTPCDFFLWGYLKSKVYLGGVSNLSVLKENITRTVTNLPPEMLHSAVESTVYRMQCLVHENGGHIEPSRCLPRESDSTE